MNAQQTPYLTPRQLVDRWNGALTTGTLANWRCRGDGPPYTKICRRILYPVAQLEAWEAKNTRAANDNAANGKGE